MPLQMLLSNTEPLLLYVPNHLKPDGHDPIRSKERMQRLDLQAASVWKGNCVVYSCDGRRFEVPLAYLRTPVFVELLRMSQEEFGFTGDGRITLPCDTAVMEYVMCLLGREASEEVEKALLSSIVMPCSHHPSRMVQQPLNQHFAVCSI